MNGSDPTVLGAIVSIAMTLSGLLVMALKMLITSKLDARKPDAGAEVNRAVVRAVDEATKALSEIRADQRLFASNSNNAHHAIQKSVDEIKQNRRPRYQTGEVTGV